MSDKLDQFRQLTDQLREARRNIEHCPVDERILLGNLADIFNEMNDDDQMRANVEWWRGWPDLYDERMMRIV